MPEDIVGVVARFTVHAEHAGEFAREARAGLVEPSRKEPGCLRYELWQDRSDPTHFAMVEEWESEAALDQHLSHESLREAGARLQHMMAGPTEMRRYHRHP